MSLERTRTRIIRPILTPDSSGNMMKLAKPYQRLIANIFDMGLMAFLILNTYKHFDVASMLPKAAMRHHYFIVILYFYFILTILPHHYFGQTIGQFIAGIKVLSANYKRLPFIKVLLRDILRPTTLFIPFPVLSKNAKAWYDGFLKSTIVDIR